MPISVDWAPQTAYVLVLVFARMGTMLMLMPGFGASNIPVRVRLSFALVFTFVMFPLVMDNYPSVPLNGFGAVVMLGHELAVGFILGGVARLILSAAQVAGATIAFQTGLSFAQMADPTQGGIQGAILGNFLAVLGLALIFALDLHYLVLAAIYKSYTLFSPTADLMIEDAARLAIDVVSGSFTVGAQMAAPFIIFGLVFFFGLGLLARLMPQIQVFFIAMPANIALGLLLFGILLTIMMTWYLNYIEQFLMKMIG
jgi:flagellar biosynthesis protein FliR